MRNGTVGLDCRLTHDPVPLGPKSLVVSSFLENVNTLVNNSRGQFQTGECHGGRGLLEWSKGTVEVVADVPGLQSSFPADLVMLSELDDHRLRATVAEVKGNSLEDHSLDSCHGSGRAIKHLGLR